MSRRRREGGAEAILNIVSGLPWQVGMALAPVSFLVAHHFASITLPSAPSPAELGQFVIMGAVRSVTGLLQYILPLLCLLGAGVSALKGRQRAAMTSHVTEAKHVGALDGLSWKQFEILVGEAFRMRGFAVQETGGGGADGGVDVVLSKNGETFLVQCKLWRAQKVGVEVVRELYGVMAARGATGGFVVTSGRFTAAAAEFAAGRNVTLIPGPQLVDMITQAKKAVGESAPAASRRPSEPAPNCPVCKGSMVLRTAKKGAQAGSQFWGCARYPVCRGTGAIAS